MQYINQVNSKLPLKRDARSVKSYSNKEYQLSKLDRRQILQLGGVVAVANFVNTDAQASTDILKMVYNAQGSIPTQNEIAQVSNAANMMYLGRSNLLVSKVGVGAWAWGDTSYWGYGGDYNEQDAKQAYDACVAKGVNFLDTAEVYGEGRSEKLVGKFMAENPGGIIATKFAPLPWRFTADQVEDACRRSLKRLGVPKVGLYMQHWPGFATTTFSNDNFLDGLARCKEAGLCEAVGVSNFKEERIRKAAKKLGERGIPLASNQVQYSLLYRKPEQNGVLEACRELGITLVAYSPLCQGLLTGKYTPDKTPSGARGLLYNSGRIREVQVLLDLMKIVASNHNKKLSEVAINWCVCKDTLPIPGVKRASHVADAAGALGWRLDDGEIAELDKISLQVGASTGAPFENW